MRRKNKKRKYKLKKKRGKLCQYGGFFADRKLAAAGLLAATAPVTIPLAMFAGPSLYRGMKREAINNFRVKKNKIQNQYQNVKKNLRTASNHMSSIKNNLKSNLKNKIGLGG